MLKNAEPFSQFISTLDQVIAGVAAGGLHETVTLLKIARLDLVVRANSITESELKYAVDTARKNLHAQTRPANDSPMTNAIEPRC